MVRIIAGMLALLGFSVIVTECINNFRVFDLRVRVPYVAIPAWLLFLFYEFAEKILANKRKAATITSNKYAKVITLNRIIVFLVLLALVVAIPLLWWGAIKKMASMANQGKVVY